MTRIKVIIAVLVLGVLLTPCSEASYSGDGNEFTVLGKVTYVGRQSIGTDVYEVVETNGRARGWFDDGVYHVIHDNCDCKSSWAGHSRTKVGHVEGVDGEEISMDDLNVGLCMRFTGKIRSDKEGKTYNNRPVYDVAQIIPCSGEF